MADEYALSALAGLVKEAQDDVTQGEATLTAAHNRFEDVGKAVDEARARLKSLTTAYETLGGTR